MEWNKFDKTSIRAIAIDFVCYLADRPELTNRSFLCIAFSSLKRTTIEFQGFSSGFL